MKQFGYGNLGFYIVAIQFFIYGTTSLFSTAVINKIGIKFSLVMGGFCKSLWVLSCVIPAYGSVSPHKDYWLYSKEFIFPFQLTISALCALGNTLLWPSKGVYIA